jgi:hypothetical protein
MPHRFIKPAAIAAVIGATFVLGAAFAQQQQRKIGYTDTPFLPGGKWRVHDGTRPQPKIISPGTFSSQATPGKPPSDAIVLFDGKDLSKWENAGGGEAKWKVENGEMTIAPGSGTIRTKEALGDVQLHIEWSAPNPPKGIDQGRGNSGVLFYNKYEVQVLDSYDNITYPDGQAGAMYAAYPPLVNATSKPGEWNVYDILFQPALFDGDGKVTRPTTVTVFHNGVVLHNHVELPGESMHRQAPAYHPHPPKGQLYLQDHGNPVRYRNIWYRELKNYDEP